MGIKESFEHGDDELLHHVILPRVLPQQKSPRLYETEMDLMKKMVQNVENLAKFLPAKTVEFFRRLHRVHTMCTKENISKEIAALQPGDTFAMFVRLQHTALMIHVPLNEQINNVQNVIVSTLSNLHPDEIYKHDSDFEFNYPEQAINVKFSHILRSEEFADQLCVLYEGLPIEEKNRDCVSKWLVTLLADADSKPASSYPFIRKKFRDEILGESKNNYFRRSNFYMCVKAMLQHNLTLQLADFNGKLLFKIVMLKFLTSICDSYKEYASFDVDLLSQMIAKMARRVEKLLPITADTRTDNIASLFNDAIKGAKETIAIIRKKIDEQIGNLQQEIAKKTQLLPLPELSFQSDISYDVPKLAAYMKARIENVKTANDANPVYTPQTYRRFFLENLPNIESINIAKDDTENRIFWSEFELMVLNEMKMNDNRWSDQELRTWTFAYANYAENKYKGNPLFVSRMLLVRLKLIAVLDYLAMKKHSQLRQHHSGVNPSMINALLIPQFADMSIAYDIEKYFQVRNAAANDPSLIGEDRVSCRSFSTKYAKSYSNMHNIRAQILEADRRNEHEKKLEWLRGREEVERYKSEANRLICEYTTDWRGYTSHSYSCTRCNYLTRANSIRMRQYERLLPTDIMEQWAVVFELQIPSEIAHLRDVLHGFAEYCRGDSETINIRSDWTNNSNLLPYCNKIHKNVTLGSTTSDTMTEYHVDCSFDWFIRENTYNCVFHAQYKQITTSIQVDSVKRLCTFVARNEYADLQWALESTHHTQNQVLASQSNCQQEITLSEYKNFGSLRADGHRLQLRKLYAMIETESLPFEKEDVLALIMQTLWECGVSGIDESIRETHIDFADPAFCSAMIELLEKYVSQQRSNWMHPLKLLNVVLIAVRAFEINRDDAVATEIVKLLRQIRVIVLEWMGQIEEAMRGMISPNEKSERELRMKSIYVAIVGGLTFFINPKNKNYEKIFEIHTDTGRKITTAHPCLQFIVSLNNSVRMYTTDESSLPSNVRMFLRLMEWVGITLEPKWNVWFEVHDLIKLVWPRAEHAKVQGMLTQAHLTIFTALCGGYTPIVTIDTITGSFLVDGFPLSRLPNHILQSDIYRWFFRDVVLEVQPDGKGFSTVQKFNDCTYEFKLVSGQITIIERKANHSEKELIDRRTLDGEFPNHLVENYSHWWNKSGNYIEFRRRAVDGEHFSKQTDIDYLFDLKRMYLHHLQSQRFLLDIKSESFKEIIHRLSRLEHPKYILVFVESTQVAKVELLRMNLKFEANLKTKDLISNEFNGMRISLSQNIGTLYGLNQGLILESVSDTNIRTMLIPNGNIISASTHRHVSVRIETEQHSPLFYQYQADEFCRQLKASNGSYASWFYLAYLHAITSFGETDPFTGMSGTERALQILQSAYAWSSAPYEPEAVKVLEMIANLTPRRKLLKQMKYLLVQVVDWPKNIPTRSAHDCFAFIAMKLLNDSQLLYQLHPECEAKEIKIDTDMELNKRNYWRCQSFNPNLRVSSTFISHKTLETVLPANRSLSLCPNTRTVCNSYHKNRCHAPSRTFSLKRFLTQDREVLTGIGNEGRLKDLLCHCVHDDFPNLWIALYEAARQQQLNREEIVVILSYFAHDGEDYDAILALQAIATNPNAFSHINPPLYNSFPLWSGDFNIEKLGDVLKRYHNRPDEYYSVDWRDTGMQQQHDQALEQVVNNIKSWINYYWPCVSFDFGSVWSQQFQYINYEAAKIEIDQMLSQWYMNYYLNDFVNSVETQLKSLRRTLGSISSNIAQLAPKTDQHFIKHEINFEAKIGICLNSLSQEVITYAQKICEAKETNSKHSAHVWWKFIHKTISESDEINHLIKAGIFPRMVPSLFLPKLIDTTTDRRLKSLVGAWAMAIAREQREKRIQVFSHRPELKAILDRETKDQPHMNWKPSEHPEWLLFEIEQNLMIRRIQIEIAMRMIEPPDIETKHSVMQLNMGEGKTAVIVPLLAAKLANGRQVCQITVLKSLFATNLKSLRQYLGGFLNRPIYIFPCRRDLPINAHIDQILRIYEECLERKGVILTLPEYRLSFQLKIYETIQNQQLEVAKRSLHVHKWLNRNVRNVLDESDAILQAKYQLIYTVGNQLRPDGGSLRWLVTQALLKRVPVHMQRLYAEYGMDKIEFDDNYVKNGNVFGWPSVSHRSDVFTPCRILDATVFEALKKALIDDFLDGRLDIDFNEMSESKKDKLRRILSKKEINRDTFLDIKRKFLEIEHNTILILSGLLRFEVLKLVLTKRWRVNYGVNVNGRRKMAIPFKAKDVAAEMTEFGHPDVAVCFTQLSYYYSGLDKNQFLRVFEILDNAQDAVAIYEKWIQSIDKRLIDPSIRTYSGVNLDDPKQRDELLFPLFRFNMQVIDFWLSNVVFSHELKIFEKKLMCTAWDLCSDHLEHRVTGFSGTNDTKNILPLTVGQNDLAELEGTNENMRKVLLDPRNQPYKNLPANVSGKQILEELVKLNIPVLLDSGALMLELNNKEVATEWLKETEKQKRDAQFDAAVYFDEKDTLQTIDRSGIVTAFDYSVYKENLARCLVYLDDSHTRGTDLKFPPSWKACVTLSGDITRDKTVQSCMRMRQLESSQAISFWASFEADIGIRKVCDLSSQDAVTNEHVIKFIVNNSREFETANMVHWTTSAFNYTKKLIAHKQYENTDDDDSMRNLYEKCVDDDFAKLIEMYGEKAEAYLKTIAWRKFDKISGSGVDRKIRSFVREMQDNVDEKLDKFASNVKRYTHALDEEQEKELEQEVEEEKQVERPPDAKPAEPMFDKRLEQLVVNATNSVFIDMFKEKALLSIADSLANTQVHEFCKQNVDAWSSFLFVTRDFQTVLQDSSQSCDEFLRPTWWIARIRSPSKDFLILLSSFECNHLLPAFRRTFKSTLFMYRPRLSRLHSNLLHKPKLQVSASLTPNSIDIEDEVQIAVYSGSMYFKDETEQNAYCGFLGLIPRPRTAEQQIAFEEKIIKENGFVSAKKRNHSEAISSAVGKCRFNDSPADFAIALIKAHHHILPKVSHVSSVLVRGYKVFTENDAE